MVDYAGSSWWLGPVKEFVCSGVSAVLWRTGVWRSQIIGFSATFDCVDMGTRRVVGSRRLAQSLLESFLKKQRPVPPENAEALWFGKPPPSGQKRQQGVAGSNAAAAGLALRPDTN
ncbi:hypothetical protein HPB47_004268, partial [Ixodes persulcatus]